MLVFVSLLVSGKSTLGKGWGALKRFSLDINFLMSVAAIGAIAIGQWPETGTIRYYERQGVLHKPPRSESGYRRYTETHLAQLNFVRHCRALGMTLSEIEVLQKFQENPDGPCMESNDLIDRQVARIKQKIGQLHVLEEQLTMLRNCCDKNLQARECGIMKALTSAAKTGKGE
ncbi:MAG: MerR family DNA-binding protein [Marinilabiliales bacterium]|nr:MerR family DNA-binding protein [Marinilabiliales bacterium]